MVQFQWSSIPFAVIIHTLMYYRFDFDGNGTVRAAGPRIECMKENGRTSKVNDSRGCGAF